MPVVERSNVVDERSNSSGPVVIKKYANRRLYNTHTSGYVTLDHLCQMVKEGVDFEVRDARTGEDITRSVLTQIIFEEENKGQNLLPIRFLRQLIRMYGDSLQAFVPGYLDMSMESFSRQQDEIRERVAKAFGGGSQTIENLARQNLAILEQAMKMFSPFPSAGRQAPEPPARPQAGNGAESQSKTPSSDELSELKSQMEAMRQQLAQLARQQK